MQLTSTAFTQGGPIPTKYTCEGRDISPPLAWQGTPAEAKSLVLIVDDPDAPDPKAPKRTWVHWVAYNLPTTLTSLDEAAALPDAAASGLNDWSKPGYGGPCPPIGEHRYFFKLYALDVPRLDLDTPRKANVEKAMAGHVLAQGELMGTYVKQGK